MQTAPALPKLAAMLETIVTVTDNLRVLGTSFNHTLIQETDVVSRQMKEPILPAPLSFEVALACTTSWLVASGQATHAQKVLDVLRSGNLGKIDQLKHPRGSAVRLALQAWMPLINGWEDGYVPTADELHGFYRSEIHDSAQFCRWGVLAPIKLLAIRNHWPDADVNRFIPPMGKFVREGLQALLGVSISDPETTQGHHLAYRMQLHLAHLGKTNVTVINSGLWAIGKGEE